MMSRHFTALAILFNVACGSSEPVPADAPAGPPAAAPAVAPAPAAAPAKASSTPSLCADGTITIDWWPGEYPAPVLQVLSPVALPARSDVCDADPSLTCTVSPGLIHPWAKGGTTRFRSITGVTRYEVLQPFTVECDKGDTTLPIGATVEERGYMAEGMCVLGYSGDTCRGECPGNGGNEARFRKLEGGAADVTVQQFAGVDCKEGHTAWIHVTDDLFKREELTRGAITGYGEVGPEGSTGSP